jgi:5-methylcytosine-specific restriction endonuclease McrA
MDAKPYPKAQQLARGERRYRRKVASPKQWQAIIAAKSGPCLVCDGVIGHDVEFHHLVSREDHGDDVAENIVPICRVCHWSITHREVAAARLLLGRLSDAEYAYMIERGGEDYPERAYGVTYGR